MPAPASPATAPPLSSYQKLLFVFLSVATFFEGFDFMALAQILPDLRASMGLDKQQGGLLVGVINIGMLLSYFLVRQADRWGRRRVLSITIAGYTTASLLSGLAPNVWTFALAQLLARMFLISEWAVASIYAAEEFPAERRGVVIGVIHGAASLGSIVCAGVVPLLLKTSLGWRSIYIVGSVPLVLMALLRRSLRETARFQAQRERGEIVATDLFRIWRTPYRRRMLHVALVWTLIYLCTQSAVVFWKEFAVGERNMTASQVGHCMTIAAIVAMPLVFSTGKLIDTVGRRWGATIVFLTTIGGVLAAYNLQQTWALIVALIFGIAGCAAVLPVVNTWNSELFPTELRSDAFAWANSLLGRIAAVLSPFLVGALAQAHSFGLAVGVTTLGPLLAIACVWALLPETSRRELEETAALR